MSNHLTSGVLKYFGDSFRWGPAVNLFEKLVVREGEVACLLAQSYFGLNEEVKAIKVLQAAIENHPQSYALLHAQCDFLRSKGKKEWAIVLAKQAVNCAPSEFVTWAKLTEVNMELGNFSDVRRRFFLLYACSPRHSQALLTLNSCPMFTYNDRDLHRMPPPSRVHLPMQEFIASSGILADEASAQVNNDADIALLRLPAPGLRGTFAKAYELLTKLVSQIGWDELLKCRSAVFVMEEEYRAQRAGAAAPAPKGSNGHLNTNGEASRSDVIVVTEEDEGADDAASVQAVKSTGPTPVPAIEVSEAGAPGLSGDAEGLDKPSIAAAPAPSSENETEDSSRMASAFSNKRLCERWLDNLVRVSHAIE